MESTEKPVHVSELEEQPTSSFRDFLEHVRDSVEGWVYSDTVRVAAERVRAWVEGNPGLAVCLGLGLVTVMGPVVLCWSLLLGTMLAATLTFALVEGTIISGAIVIMLMTCGCLVSCCGGVCACAVALVSVGAKLLQLARRARQYVGAGGPDTRK